jgi:AraC-like DNA-binding protein
MAGESIAFAAQAGGFADQAHFSRATRRAFGITPKDIARLLA